MFEYEVHFWFSYLDDEKNVGHSEEYVFRSPQEADACCGRLQSRENLKDRRLISITVDKLECCDTCGEWVRRWNEYQEYALAGKEPECLWNEHMACRCRAKKSIRSAN